MRPELSIGGRSIYLRRGDITTLEVDAIVNAANSSLLGGGGVDGAIHRKGGPSILEECRAIRATQGRCPPGQAVVTGAGELPAKHVIHTVGPIYATGERGEGETLASAYRSSLRRAEELQVRTVAFPSISTGAYRFPIEDAAHIALRTIRDFLCDEAESVRAVAMVLFSDVDLRVYVDALRQLENEG
jgi:O-acetyl-ADP-ribose deacetylase (regulator of RNase III)